MEKLPVFPDVETAIGFLTRFTQGLVRLWLWTLLALAHVAVVLLLLVWLWWTQTTPEQMADLATRLWRSRFVAVLATLGVSLLMAMWFYWRGARKLIEWLYKRHAWRIGAGSR